MRKWLFIVALSILVLTIIAYAYNHSSYHEESKKSEISKINDNKTDGVENSENHTTKKSANEQDSNSKNILTSEENINIICERIKNIDFRIQEFPINCELYDSDTDKIYKEAFFKTVNNEVALKYQNTGKNVLFIELFRGRWQDNDEFLRFLIKSGDYYYFDFDGDGLPELVITTAQGSIVLKYKPENKQVYYYAGFSDDWRILGSRQMYYYSASSANRIFYCYISLYDNGVINQEVNFDSYSVHNETGWSKEYFVSIDECDNVKTSEENWNEITKDFFKAVDNALPHMSFEEVFGEIS